MKYNFDYVLIDSAIYATICFKILVLFFNITKILIKLFNFENYLITLNIFTSLHCDYYKNEVTLKKKKK